MSAIEAPPALDPANQRSEFGPMKPGAAHTVFINGRFLQQSFAGVQRYAHEVLKGLDRLADGGQIDPARYRIRVLAPPGRLYNVPKLKHVEIRQVGRLTGQAWLQFELPRFSRNGLLFSTSNAHPVLALRPGRRNVVTIHDLSYMVHPGAYSLGFHALYRAITPLILRRSSAVITVSWSARKDILRYYPRVAEKLRVIYNGAPIKGRPDIARSCERGCQRLTRPFVLWVGSLSRRKNPQGVIEALRILNRKHDVGLVMVGGAHRAFRDARLRIASDLSDKIQLRGQVDNEAELIELYEKAVCLAFPSFYEAMPLPPLEAMACGCPVVASKIESVEEECGDAALYCDPDDPQDVAQKIEKIISEPALAEELRQRGFERIKRFSWNRCAQETWNLIAEVLQRVV